MEKSVSHPERFQPHLFTLNKKVPWRFIENLPIEWSHLICKCDRFFWVTEYSATNRQPPRCGECRRVPIQNFCLCQRCNTFYIRNFTHMNWCNYCEMLCWDCCEAVGDDYNCCDAQTNRRRLLNNLKRPPVGNYVPAKKYESAEELYADTVSDFTL